MQYRFHHLGIPTTEVKPNERYSAAFKMFTSDHNSELFNIQFHRFEAGSPLHPLIQTLPHAAYIVDDLGKAIEGKELLLGPYEPIKDFKVAIINENGVPVEFIETTLSDEEIWGRAVAQEDLNTEGLKF